jgi:hypothetical protein
LPEVTSPFPDPIYALSVTHMQRFQNFLQTAFMCGHGHKMNVVGHQAISQNLKLVLLAVVAQPVKIGVIILFDKKTSSRRLPLWVMW